MKNKEILIKSAEIILEQGGSCRIPVIVECHNCFLDDKNCFEISDHKTLAKEYLIKNKKTTMKDRIKSHLERLGKITTWEAIDVYRCTRLSEYIRQLRADGMKIETVFKTTKNRYGDKIKYGVYKLIV